MKMHVSFLYGEKVVYSADALLDLLRQRAENESNDFWMSPEPGTFPEMSITITGDHAICCYRPERGHPGWNSLSGIEDGDEIQFANGTDIDYFRMNERYVVPVSTAYRVAVEFLERNAMPSIIEWESLVEGE